MGERKKIRVELNDNGPARSVFGEHGRHLNLIERGLGVELHARGNRVTVVGESQRAGLARDLLNQLYTMAQKGLALGPRDVERATRDLTEKQDLDLKDIYSDTVLICARGHRITPKSLAQKIYVDAMRENDIVFSIGPAGTGKTYLAMAMAVRQLQEKKVTRIILVRPAVEAGEKLGFLPGDMLEKVNPYLRPLYDALNDMMDFRQVTALIDEGCIEVAPLAFMRGRTLNDSFVVMDEAQNTTTDQMKMFLTRLGYDSKAVITGDVTQTDLPEGQQSGLVEASRILHEIEDISFCYFDERDVVRHPLVQRIIKAYEAYEADGSGAVGRPVRAPRASHRDGAAGA
jgi:phosphate starvation-inducible PhoH-like protein